MTTLHSIFIGPSQHMTQIKDDSINLVVTSPPYPMIEMWDDIMAKQNPLIADCIEIEPEKAFELMHKELDKVWEECFRVITPGGFLCINIGDATRTINGNFHNSAINLFFSIFFSVMFVFYTYVFVRSIVKIKELKEKLM